MRLNWILILIFSCVQAEQNHNTLLFSKDSTQKIAEAEQSKINPKPDQLILIDFVGASEEDSVLLTRIFDNSEVYFELPESVEATTAVKGMSYSEKANYYSLSGSCNTLTRVEVEIETLPYGENFQLFVFYNEKDLYKIEFDITEREGFSTITYSELENIAPNKCLVLCFDTDDVTDNVGYQKRVGKHWYVLNDKSLIKILYIEMLYFELNVSHQSFEDYEIENLISYERSEMEVRQNNNGWSEVLIQRYYNQERIEYKGNNLRLTFSDNKYQQID